MMDMLLNIDITFLINMTQNSRGLKMMQGLTQEDFGLQVRAND